jgi:hypothetical protein
MMVIIEFMRRHHAIAPTRDNQMASVKVFVPTYQRPILLGRALASLIGQRYQDWTAEVHNDDPRQKSIIDGAIKELGDTRISVVHHSSNIGPMASFNLFYAGNEPAYVSILEDDNTWEEDFLQQLVSALDANPQASLVWCNQRITREVAPNCVKDTGRFVHEKISGHPELVEFGQEAQAIGALHANGAMVARSVAVAGCFVPTDWPFGAVEHFRERLFQYPILYVPTPLATFTQTLETSRSKSRYEWIMVQSLLAGSFFASGCLGPTQMQNLFEKARLANPPQTNALLLGMLAGRTFEFWGMVRPVDLLRLAVSIVRCPYILKIPILRGRLRTWFEILKDSTAQRIKGAPKA